jgi:phage-related protein/molybdopterin converting factor small subunit
VSPGQEQFFTPEDAAYIASVLGSAGLGAQQPAPALPALTLEDIKYLDLSALATSLHGWTDPIGQLKAWLYDRLKEIASWFADVVRGIYDLVIAPVLNAIKSTVESIYGYLTKVPGAVVDFVGFIKSKISEVWEAFQKTVVDPASKAIGGFIDSVSRALDSVKKFLTEALPGWIADVQKAVSGIWDWVQKNLVTPLSSAIAGFIDAVTGGLRAVGDFFTKTLPGWLESAWKAISGAASAAWDFIQANIIAPLSSAIGGFVSSVMSGAAAVSNWIAGVQKAVGDLQAMLGGLAAGISGAFDSVRKFLTETLPGQVARAVGELERSIAGIWGAIQRDVVAPLTSAVGAVVGALQSGIEALHAFFTRDLPGLIADIRDRILALPGELWSRLVREGQTLLQHLAGLRDVIISIPSRVYEALKDFIEGTRSALGLVAGFVATIREAAYNFFAAVREFFEDPLGFIVQRVLAPLASALAGGGGSSASSPPLGMLTDGGSPTPQNPLQFLASALGNLAGAAWNAIVGALSWLADQISKAVAAFFRAIQSAIEAVGGFFATAANMLVAGVKKVTHSISKAFGWFLDEVLGAVVAYVVEPFKSAVESLIRAYGQAGYLERLWAAEAKEAHARLRSVLLLGSLVAGGALLAKFFAFWLKAAGNVLERIVREVEASGAPLGVGAKLRLQPLVALGAIVKDVAEILDSSGAELVRSFLLGAAMWTSRVLVRPFVAAFRNILPVELPPLESLVQACRRLYPTVGWRDVVEYTMYMMAMYGYAADFVDLVLRYTDELAFRAPERRREFVTVVDRFGVRRALPTALVFEIPTRSEMVTMMIRDIVIEPEEFKKMVAMHGVTEDVAALYYLLHFRYPSPERLAQFYWRGMAGVLWYPETLEEEPIKRAFRVPTTAKAPVELNFRADILNDMMFYYMKWHDLCPVAWKTNYPTDKAIVMELTADLPTKVDMRWMTRWGIFQHLADAGISPYASIRDVFEKLATLTGRETVRDRVEPVIPYDVRMLARMLVATGVHPLFAAMSAVAEAHVALTDEFTLVRTGFIEALRRGLITLDTAEKLMSGLFTITFTTAYLDVKTGKWSDVTYKKPVYWLPAERRLLQLRSAFDRFESLSRAAMASLAAVVRYLAMGVSEAVERFRKYYALVADHVSSMVKRLTGVDWRPELDEDYVSLWRELLAIEHELGTKRWIRTYATRIMAWITYRMSYGWVREEDYAELVDQLVQKKWLVEEEAEFFKTVMHKVLGMVKREMIPTPLTLATMAEYMVVDRETIERVLEDHRVPEEYKPLYRTYIAVKPFKSDFKALITRARAALARKAITEEEWKKLLDEARGYGFRDAEISILERIAELDEKIADARMWRPTLAQLITISEYVPEALALLEKYRVEKDFADAIAKYARIRPLADDARAAISAYYRALRYSKYFTAVFGELPEFKIPDEVAKQVEKLMNVIGMTAEERSARELGATIDTLIDLMRERARELKAELREWKPTLLTLVTISEYVPEAAKLVEKYVIDPEFKPVVLRYAQVRPFADDARAAITAYYRALRYSRYFATVFGKQAEFEIPEAVAKSVEDLMKAIGVTDQERAARELAAAIDVLVDLMRERARELRTELREWRPSLLTLITISEYVPEATKLLEKYVIDPEFKPVVLKYASIRSFADDARVAITAYYRALRYSKYFAAIFGKLPEFEIPKEVSDRVEALMSLIGMTDQERAARELAATIDALIDLMRERARELREWRPSLPTLITISEYVPEATKLIEKYVVDPEFRPVVLKYAVIKPLADDVRVAITAYFRALRYSKYFAAAIGRAPEFEIPADLQRRVESIMELIGMTPEERAARELAADIEVLIDLMRERARELRAEMREWRPTLPTLITISEYVPEAASLIVKYVVDPEFRPVVEKYARVRPIADDARAAVSAYYRLKRYAMLYKLPIPDEVAKAVENLMNTIGMTPEERAARDLAAHIEFLIDYMRTEAREYVPTPAMLATIAEYTEVPDELIREAFEARRVPEKWRGIWAKYIFARALADDARVLMASYMRVKRLGVSIPPELEAAVTEVFRAVGVTDAELKIRELAALLDSLAEAWPTLGQLATLVEYVEVPPDYVAAVLRARRVEKTFAALWTKYLSAREIAGEVGALVSTFRALYVSFAVPEDVVKKVRELMSAGGWTKRELEVFDFDLALRKAYRTLSQLVPTVRQFAADAPYLPDWQALLEDLLRARGVEVEKYQKQVEYYKRLIRNRMVWRQLSWYRAQLAYAYERGAISREELLKRLAVLKNYGLSDEEINILLDGMELRRLARALRAR